MARVLSVCCRSLSPLRLKRLLEGGAAERQSCQRLHRPEVDGRLVAEQHRLLHRAALSYVLLAPHAPLLAMDKGGREGEKENGLLPAFILLHHTLYSRTRERGAGERERAHTLLGMDERMREGGEGGDVPAPCSSACRRQTRPPHRPPGRSPGGSPAKGIVRVRPKGQAGQAVKQ